MSVPIPSAASTEPEGKVIFAVPGDFALKVMVKSLPELPVKPGGKSTPSKVTLPEVLEKEGSCAQKLTNESVLETEETESKSVGKEMRPEAAFIGLSVLETKTFTVKDESAEYVPERGERERVAAST